MKLKTLFTILVMFTTMLSFSISTHAQDVFKKTASNSTSVVTGSTTDTLNYTLPGYFDLVVFQPVVTKVSGTISGSGVLYGSVDGVNFLTIGDTITLTNVSKNTAIWIHTSHPYLYYRFLVTGGGGTMNGTVVMNILARKHT